MKHNPICQALGDSLTASSRRQLSPSCLLKFTWCVEHRGLPATLRLLGARAARVCRVLRPGTAAGPPATEGVLHLQPGEFVQVKSEPEIRATLDADDRHRGLLWMPDMARFCGGRYRVHKRVERVMLESTGQIRRVRDTVLLEGVMCENLYDCDRSCFHFWREAWLCRAPETPAPGRAQVPPPEGGN